MSKESTNHELHAVIMAAALASVLEPNEGIIIHHDGDGYFVFLVHDPVDDSYDVVVNSDDAFLQVPNFERIDMTDDEQHSEIFKQDDNETLQ